MKKISINFKPGSLCIIKQRTSIKSNLLNGYKQGDKLKSYIIKLMSDKIVPGVKHFFPKLTRMPVVPLPDKSSVMRDIRKRSIYQKGELPEKM